jgi:GH35 family endo-1,4-beta-xylanase
MEVRPDPGRERELLAGADERIERHRKADAAVVAKALSGRPVRGAHVSVTQTRHAFLFGCNFFNYGAYPSKEQNEAYGRAFAALLNYATLPFYWGSYEREKGKEDTARIRTMARWCRDHGIERKGHPLVWHEVFPSWAPADAEATRALLEARVRRIVGEFRGLIDIWDVFNEATVAAQFDNAVGRWVKQAGAAEAVGAALHWARMANPRATLLYNDFNVGPAFEALVNALQMTHRPIDAIGIQSHMHRGEWPLERVWQTCETYARFALPIHFTELTVLSGAHKTDNNWQTRRTDWHSTREGEARQANYVEKLYRLLYSHPSVAAITWWDFMDGGWQGAPGGLVAADLKPKPVYERLKALIRNNWWTEFKGVTDVAGRCAFRAFHGRHRVTIEHPDGRRFTRAVDIRPKRENRTEFEVV